MFTEDCEGEIEIVDLLPFAPIVDPALSRLVVERGVCEPVRDGRGTLHTYTFSTPHMATIVLENKVSASVRLLSEHMYYVDLFSTVARATCGWQCSWTAAVVLAAGSAERAAYM